MTDSPYLSGTYRIFNQGGALAGTKIGDPLTVVEAPNNPDQEVWTLNVFPGQGHLIRLKSSPDVGLSFQQNAYPNSPIVLDEGLRMVRIVSSGQLNEYVIHPAFDGSDSDFLVMSTGQGDNVREVKWMPNDQASVWRFEKIE